MVVANYSKQITVHTVVISTYYVIIHCKKQQIAKP